MKKLTKSVALVLVSSVAAASLADFSFWLFSIGDEWTFLAFVAGTMSMLWLLFGGACFVNVLLHFRGLFVKPEVVEIAAKSGGPEIAVGTILRVRRLNLQVREPGQTTLLVELDDRFAKDTGSDSIVCKFDDNEFKESDFIGSQILAIKRPSTGTWHVCHHTVGRRSSPAYARWSDGLETTPCDLIPETK